MNLYANKLAKHGYVTLAFDPSYNGYSRGEPRHVSSGLSCRSLVTQDFLDYCCGVGGYVGLGGDGLTGDLDGDLA